VSEALVHVTPIQVRFGDTDRFGHINNASFATYAEIARIELITSLGHPLGGMILAHMAIDFRRQLHVGDALVVWTRVARIGRSSIAMSQALVRPARPEIGHGPARAVPPGRGAGRRPHRRRRDRDRRLRLPRRAFGPGARRPAGAPGGVHRGAARA
jgi:YbgC/YbaW family acyl-CoA thioester hydrolase